MQIRFTATFQTDNPISQTCAFNFWEMGGRLTELSGECNYKWESAPITALDTENIVSVTARMIEKLINPINNDGRKCTQLTVKVQ